MRLRTIGAEAAARAASSAATNWARRRESMPSHSFVSRPIVFLEAAACAVPQVAGDSGGAPDAVREISVLLARAYRRSAAIRCVPADRSDAQPQSGLALPGESSVHGLVP